MNKQALIKLHILLLIIVNSMTVTSQKKEIYFNEKMDIINKSDFEKRFQSKLFNVTEWEDKKSKNFKLRFIEYYGKIDSVRNNQLRQILSENIDLDKNKLWQISYFDTLPNTKLMRDQSVFVYIDSLKQDTIYSQKRISWSNNRYDLDKLTLKGYIHGFNDFTRLFTKKNKHRSRKKDSFWLFNYDNKFPLHRIKKPNIFKDPRSILRRLFNDGQIPYELILLYPDGKFYVTSQDNSHFKDLSNIKTYETEKSIWLERVHNLDSK